MRGFCLCWRVLLLGVVGFVWRFVIVGQCRKVGGLREGHERDGEMRVDGSEVGKVEGDVWQFYHRSDDLLRIVEGRVGRSDGRCEVDYMRDEEEDGGNGKNGDKEEMLVVRVHANREVEDVSGEKIKVMVTGNEHGRELITGEVLLRFVEQVCGHGFGRSVSDMHVEYIVAPIVNVWGRKEVEEGKLCERLSERGVDLNRNFDYRWGEHDDTSLPDEERPGSHAFSESESRIIRLLVQRFRPDAYVTLHSGDRALVMPWDSGMGRIDTGGRLIGLLQKIKEFSCIDCRIGTSRELFGYNAFGTGVDYMVGHGGVSLAFTAEIYGNASNLHDECFPMFNPGLISDYDRIVTSWSQAIKVIGRTLFTMRNDVKHKGSQPNEVASKGKRRTQEPLIAAVSANKRVVIDESKVTSRHSPGFRLRIICIVLCFILIGTFETGRRRMIRPRRFAPDSSYDLKMSGGQKLV